MSGNVGVRRKRDERLPVELPAPILDALKESHAALYGHSNRLVQNRVWTVIRKLAEFMCSQYPLSDNQIPRSILGDYYSFLVKSKLAGGTKQARMNYAKSLVYWCARNNPKIIKGVIQPENRAFIREAPRVPPVLDRQVAEEIMRRCLDDVHQIVSRLQNGKASLKNLETEKDRLLQRLLQIGSGLLPSQRVVSRSKECLARRVLDGGGLKQLGARIFPDAGDLLPFYIAIQFQLAANPQAVANIRRDCIEENPLRMDREWVMWEKPRSGYQQRVDFPVGKTFSAPQLIRELIDITSPLVAHAGKNKELLFLFFSRGWVSVPSAQTWQNELRQFIQRHNLPFFTFFQLRRTAAVLHHKEAGSILAAKRRLNHRSVATTYGYTRLSDLSERHEKVIAAGQRNLQNVANNISGKKRPDTNSVKTSGPAETVFGFVCEDPYAGFGSISGAPGPCDHFMRCATCPGAVVPLDRPDIVAALIRSVDELTRLRSKAEREGWEQRFYQLYEPTLKVIQTKLLPFVSPRILEVAQNLVSARPFPPLE